MVRVSRARDHHACRPCGRAAAPRAGARRRVGRMAERRAHRPETRRDSRGRGYIRGYPPQRHSDGVSRSRYLGNLAFRSKNHLQRTTGCFDTLPCGRIILASTSIPKQHETEPQGISVSRFWHYGRDGVTRNSSAFRYNASGSRCKRAKQRINPRLQCLPLVSHRGQTRAG